MRKPQLSFTQKAVALTLLKEGKKTQKEVAKRFKVHVRTIENLVRKAKTMGPDEIVPKRGLTGGHNKTKLTLLKLHKLKKIVQKKPFLSCRQIKQNSPHLFGNIAIRTLQHALKDKLGLAARRPAKKPLLTEQQKQRRMAFARKHLNKSKVWWRNVMFSDESNFKTIRFTSRNTVRRPRGTRFDPKFTRKSVKHPPGCMVWGCFSGKEGRGGLFFLPKNTTMNTDVYINCLDKFLMPFMQAHGVKRFLQDGAPCHTSKRTLAHLAKQPFQVVDWPGQSPDLNPIENCWNWMKDRLQDVNITSVPHLQEELNKLWIQRTPLDYLRKLSDSMPKRMQMVLDSGGNSIKY